MRGGRSSFATAWSISDEVSEQVIAKDGALKMQCLDDLRIALRALARNKLRAFLTMLGIIIGVGAVIAMVAIGEGAKATIRAQIAESGHQRLIVLPGSNVRAASAPASAASIRWSTAMPRRWRANCRRWPLPRRFCAARIRWSRET